MNVLFLDHQGVMLTAPHPRPGDLDVVGFDPAAIAALLRLHTIVQPNLAIVVSSDWKRWASLSELQKFYRRQGLPAPIGATNWMPNPANYNLGRVSEIQMWLLEHIGEWVAWAAVDDLDLSALGQNFVRTVPTEGLAGPGIVEALVRCYC